MGLPRFDSNQRPRELRRRVVLPARLRNGAAWSDVCILNISSRGLMVQASRASRPGSVVELHRGAYVIHARVVWQEGARAGLRVENPLPVDEILTLSQAPDLRLTAGGSRVLERRKAPRDHESSRIQSRAVEFAAAAFIAGALSMAALSMLEEAFAKPMRAVETALTPN